MLDKIKDLYAVQVRGDAWMNKLMFHVKHPIFILTMTVPFILAVSYYALFVADYSVVFFASIFVLGAVTWNLLEYCIHRFVFHDLVKFLRKVPAPWDKVIDGFHPAHHRDPNDKFLVLAPPFGAFVVTVVLYWISFLFTRDYLVSGVFMSGLSSAYLFYEWIHYGSHFFKFRAFPIGRYYKRYHLYHHFKRPKEAYGVTGPVWDHVFKTSKSQ
ncbi:MAG: sterol desaturase family protein [Deltaproteobacteria bacterium]|nr:sterol desaturase family protein [Deltaproteobacteria bacterium]